MMKINYFSPLAMIALLATTLTGCSDEMEPTAIGETCPLEITAVMDSYNEENTKGLVTGTSFPSARSIGVKLLNSSGGNYDGKTYNNIQATSNGTGSTQSWTLNGTILLSSTVGTLYGYYPYAAGTDLTAITMTTGSGLSTNVNDYMYGSVTNVSHNAPSVTLPMQHALVAVSITLEKGTYTGTGTVTALKWSSAGVGQSGTLNAQNGNVTNVQNLGTEFSAGITSTSIGTTSTYTFLAVPNNSSAQPSFTVIMDGQAYTVKGTSVNMAKGNHYKYRLTMDGKTLSISAVSVTPWTSQTTVTVRPNF